QVALSSMAAASCARSAASGNQLGSSRPINWNFSQSTLNSFVPIRCVLKHRSAWAHHGAAPTSPARARDRDVGANESCLWDIRKAAQLPPSSTLPIRTKSQPCEPPRVDPGRLPEPIPPVPVVQPNELG